MRCNIHLSAIVSKIAIAGLVWAVMPQYSVAAPVRPGPPSSLQGEVCFCQRV